MPGSERQNNMFEPSPVKQYVQKGNPMPVTSCGRRRNTGTPLFAKAEPRRTIGTTDIAKNPDIAKEYKIAVVPTIIIFKDGEEVARFQADLSFKMVATREEVQEEIDNQLMSDF